MLCGCECGFIGAAAGRAVGAGNVGEAEETRVEGLSISRYPEGHTLKSECRSRGREVMEVK